MIAFLQGTVADVEEEAIVLDVNHVGYRIIVPSSLPAQLPPPGQEVRIHTYLSIREDAAVLYGFLTKEELHTFKQLITVNGVGPKAGLSILSALGTEGFRLAVLSQDAKAISRAPGIGSKTAQRILLDLKDKVSLSDTFVAREAQAYQAGLPGAETPGAADAVQALTALGYSSSEALKAVRRVPDTAEKDSEQVLKEALKYLYE